MGIVNAIKSFFYERDKSGNHWYKTISGSADWSDLSNRMEIVRKHPVLLPIFELYASYLSVVEFSVEGDVEHPLVIKLNKPNQYQTKEDFLSEFAWFYLGFGYVYQYTKGTAGFTKDIERTSIYNLKSNKIDFGTNFKTPIGLKENDFKKTRFIYDPNGEKISLTFEDVLRYHDLPTIGDNYATSPSRLDSHKEAISNIQKAFEAKNIIIGSNGRELFSNGSAGSAQHIPMDNQEKEDIERKLTQSYGLGFGKRRGVVVNKNVEWKSLHIPLKELGLDDSVIKDATMLLRANNISPEQISYADKQPKYENRELAELAFVTRVMQPIANDLAKTIGNHFGVKLQASYANHPIMQKAENMRVDKLSKYSLYLSNAVQSGFIEQEEAKRRFKEYEEAN